jgi:putative oxidoreductase
MLTKLLSTNPDWLLTIVRLVLGVILFAHGAQKSLGWFGGAGYTQTVRALREQAHLPYLVALFVVLVEFLGGLFLIVGLFGRLAALGIAAMMIGAIITVHYRYGLFLNWFGEKKGHGFEYHLLAIALALIVFVRGSGALSLDHAWYQHVSNSRFTSAVLLFVGGDV